jgi:hypothetical protein
MVEIGKYTLSDAIRQLWRKPGGDKRSKPLATHNTVAGQVHEGKESREAGRTAVSSWDRMVEIGRGNSQAGRHGP